MISISICRQLLYVCLTCKAFLLCIFLTGKTPGLASFFFAKGEFALSIDGTRVSFFLSSMRFMLYLLMIPWEDWGFISLLLLYH